MYQIYPKLIHKSKLLPKQNAAFVLMPFAETFDEVYAEIKRALRTVGFACQRADDLDVNRPIMTNIVCEIISSHFVIADLTDKNANVFYEVGVAHSFRDLANVILISQSIDFVPFDLRHLPIILYDRDNLKGLLVRLTKRIMENKGYFAGQVRLRERYQHQFGGEAEFEEVIDFIDLNDRDHWPTVLQLFDIEDALSDQELALRVFVFRSELSKMLVTGRHRLFRNAYKIYRDLLCKFAENQQIDEYVIDILDHSRFPEFRLDEHEMLGLVIDLALGLYGHPRFKSRALSWLFTYLMRPKVAGVDINRAKIEHFIMFSADPEIHDYLMYSLANDDYTLRETAADFLGELGLASAVGTLVVTLEREPGEFVARSIIAALGKIGAPDGGAAILKWVTSHAQDIEQRKLNFIMDHARKALTNIDRKHQTHFLSSLPSITV